MCWSCSFVAVGGSFSVQFRAKEKYFAFLVGINQYTRIAPLLNCLNDAKGVEDMLIDSGYLRRNVFSVMDGTHATLTCQLTEFTRRLNGAEGCHVVFFYAGHGAEGVGGETVLMPNDADLTRKCWFC